MRPGINHLPREDFILSTDKSNISPHLLRGWSRYSADWGLSQQHKPAVPWSHLFGSFFWFCPFCFIFFLSQMEFFLSPCLRLLLRGFPKWDSFALIKAHSCKGLTFQTDACDCWDGFVSARTLFESGAHPSAVICVSVHLNKVIPPPSFFYPGMSLFFAFFFLSCGAARLWFV